MGSSPAKNYLILTAFGIQYFIYLAVSDNSIILIFDYISRIESSYGEANLPAYSYSQWMPNILSIICVCCVNGIPMQKI